jgi:hypothetical protein
VQRSEGRERMRQEKEEKEFNGLKAVRQLLRSKINRK